MPQFKFDKNNTEGHYPTAFVAQDAEIKKNGKIVATDLVDLYDVDINNPQNNQALTYNNGKWINGIVTSGGACDIFTGYNEHGYTNSVFINKDTTITNPNGSYDRPFKSLKECFDWLRNHCSIIPEEISLKIQLLTDVIVSEKTYLNHPYGHRITIEGNGYKIIVDIDLLELIIYRYEETFPEIDNIYTTEHNTILLSKNKEILQSGVADIPSIKTTDYYEKKYDYVIMSNDKSNNTQQGIIKEDGTLWVKGNNQFGQLGLGDNIDRNVFTQVGTDTDWKYISSSFTYKMSIKEDGTLWATGRNNYGQLGLGDNTDRNVFTQVGTDTDWSYVSTSYHTAAIKTDRTLWVTGRNNHGQLGLGDNTDRNVFTIVQYDCYTVQCGIYTTVVEKQWYSSREIFATGRNNYGQLGLGDNIDRVYFTHVVEPLFSNLILAINHTIVLILKA